MMMGVGINRRRCGKTDDLMTNYLGTNCAERR